MEYREIQVKGILNRVIGDDDWFCLSDNMSLYRGCEYQCIYCDTRSDCYQVEYINDAVLIKVNVVSLLQETLSRKKKIGMIGFGSMNDLYNYAEKQDNLTWQALEVGAKYFIPAFGMTMRTGQREYCYKKLGQYFPGVRQMYEVNYQDAYHCPAQNRVYLNQSFYDSCKVFGLATCVAPYPGRSKEQ